MFGLGYINGVRQHESRIGQPSRTSCIVIIVLIEDFVIVICWVLYCIDKIVLNIKHQSMLICMCQLFAIKLHSMPFIISPHLYIIAIRPGLISSLSLSLFGRFSMHLQRALA